MPVNQVHAFATGETYPLSYTNPSKIMRWGRLILLRLVRGITSFQRAAASESFTQNAIIGANCRLGPDAWCVNFGPQGNITLGQEVICRGILRCENWDDAHLDIADYVYIGDDCIISCANRIEIGQFTMLAHGVQLFDNDSHPIDPFLREQDYLTVLKRPSEARQPIASAPISIGERVWLGFNAIVLKGVRIGEGSIVAAGSVVTSDVPPYCVVAGNPARVIRHLQGNWPSQENGVDIC